MTKEEKARAKAGEDAKDIWLGNPARVAQKDTSARWMVKYSKAKRTKEGNKDAGLVVISVPHFGYKNHITAFPRITESNVATFAFEPTARGSEGSLIRTGKL